MKSVVSGVVRKPAESASSSRPPGKVGRGWQAGQVRLWTRASSKQGASSKQDKLDTQL